jgi:hypothetical protein
MFKDLRDKTRELMGLAKEANMVSQHNVEMDQQAKLFRMLSEYDQLNVAIGHAQYMVNHFEHEWRSTGTIEDFTNNHQAMMLCRKHLIQLQAQRDELEGYINYLGSQQ